MMYSFSDEPGIARPLNKLGRSCSVKGVMSATENLTSRAGEKQNWIFIWDNERVTVVFQLQHIWFFPKHLPQKDFYIIPLKVQASLFTSMSGTHRVELLAPLMVKSRSKAWAA